MNLVYIISSFLSLLLFLSVEVISSKHGLNFLLLADWGTEGKIQSNIARQMALLSKRVDARFVIALGDNFYPKGVQNDTDPQWNSTFQSVYRGKSLHIPWYCILGNHDYYSNAQAQLDYYRNKRDRRWTMPSNFYAVVHKIPGSKHTLEIVYIDTTKLVPKRTMINNETPDNEVENSYSLVESMLFRSNATWLFVAGHHALYSIAADGDNKYLIDRLTPLFHKYQVRAYFNGHDHTFQHFHQIDNNIHFFGIGLGGQTNDYPNGQWGNELKSKGLNGFKYGSLAPGFGWVNITSNEFSVFFVQQDGFVLYNTTIYRNNKPKIMGFNEEKISLIHAGTKNIFLIYLWIVVVFIVLLFFFLLRCRGNKTQRNRTEDVNTQIYSNSRQDLGFEGKSRVPSILRQRGMEV